jgi:hypothetical protein
VVQTAGSIVAGMVLRLGATVAFALVVPLLLAAAGPGAVRPDRSGRRTVTLGRSLDGRTIVAVETGDFDASRKALVVGCIHGNEPAGIAVANLLTRAAPPRELDLCFHQHLDLVDDSEGSIAIEHRFAGLTDLRPSPLPREPGSAVGWTNHRIPAGTAFVVEFPVDALSPAAVCRFARAILSIAGPGSHERRPR